MPAFAANLSLMFQEHPFLDRFHAAAGAGFRGVECLFPYAHPAGEIRARLDAAGLTQVLFNLPPGDFAAGDRGTAAIPGCEAEFRAGVDLALTYAQILGCPRLHVMAGIPGPDVPAAQALETYLANLAYALRQSEGQGVTLLIEPINRRDMPGYYLNSLAQAEQVIRTLDHPRLRLQLDWYHAQISGGDLSVSTRRYWPLVGHLQLAGVPDRHEPDLGEVHYPHLFRLVDELGYDGWIGCEYRPARSTLEGLGWLRAATGR